MNVQLDLLEWADARPSTIIDAREKFDRRAVDHAIALAVGHVPFRNGDVVPFIRRASASAPRSASPSAVMQVT